MADLAGAQDANLCCLHGPVRLLNVVAGDDVTMSHSKPQSSDCNSNGNCMRKPLQIPNIRCNPDRFSELVSLLDNNQKSWVTEMGFGSLLRLSLRKIDRSLAMWLMRRFDTKTHSIHVRETCSIQVTPNDIGWVLGIPGPNQPVPMIKDTKLIRKLKEQYGNRKGIDEKATFRRIVQNSDKEIEFKQTFLLYTLGVLLCPTQSSKISPLHLKVIHNAVEAHAYNWCQYVFDWLVSSASRFKRSGSCGIGFGGCSLFLMVFYLDRLNLCQPVNWSLNDCRVDAWPPDYCRYVISLDKKRNGDFGHKQIVKDVIYGKEYPIGTSTIRWEEIRITPASKQGDNVINRGPHSDVAKVEDNKRATMI